MAAPIKTKLKRITSWSFSRYAVYRECPLKAKLKFIDRLEEPSSPAMDRGTVIHKLAEDYVKGTITRMPPDLKKVADILKTCRTFYKRRGDERQAIAEDSWAFTGTWEKTVWNDWAKCALRIKLDFAHVEKRDGKTVLIITDWKTGKFREEKNAEYLEQLDLYALAGLILYPEVDEAWPRLVYTDQGITYPKTEGEIVYARKDVKKLKLEWVKRTAKMLLDTIFAPRPGNYCRHCHFRKANNGPCKY